MVVSYRRMLSQLLLLVPFLGETFVCAEPLKIHMRATTQRKITHGRS